MAADRLTRQRRARSTAAEADTATPGRRRRRCAVAGRERERGRWRWQGQRMLMAFASANPRSRARAHSLRREPEGCAWGWSTRAGREESRARDLTRRHRSPPWRRARRAAAPRRLRLARPVGDAAPPPPPPQFFFSHIGLPSCGTTVLKRCVSVPQVWRSHDGGWVRAASRRRCHTAGTCPSPLARVSTRARGSRARLAPLRRAAPHRGSALRGLCWSLAR